MFGFLEMLHNEVLGSVLIPEVFQADMVGFKPACCMHICMFAMHTAACLHTELPWPGAEASTAILIYFFCWLLNNVCQMQNLDLLYENNINQCKCLVKRTCFSFG